MNVLVSSDFNDVDSNWPSNELALIPILNSWCFTILPSPNNDLSPIVDLDVASGVFIPKILSSNSYSIVIRYKAWVFKLRNFVATISPHRILFEPRNYKKAFKIFEWKPTVQK